MKIPPIINIEKELNTSVTIARYERSKSFTEMISELFNENFFYIGSGISSGLKSENNMPIMT